MKLQFEKRFEEALQKIHNALQGKGGVKKLDKVHQRIGRAKEKYPSVQGYYLIEVSSDEKTNLATATTWKKTKRNTIKKTSASAFTFYEPI